MQHLHNKGKQDLERTNEIDGHKIEGDAGGGLEGGINDRDLGVALAEVGEHGTERLGLGSHLHRLAGQAVPLVDGLLFQCVLERCLRVRLDCSVTTGGVLEKSGPHVWIYRSFCCIHLPNFDTFVCFPTICVCT